MRNRRQLSAEQLEARYVLNGAWADPIAPRETEVMSHGGPQQDMAGGLVLHENGEWQLAGNTWKAIPINYEVTADTILRFQFRGGAIGELHGIGVDNDLNLSHESWFTLWGTQTYFGQRDFDGLYAAGGDWLDYEIPLGQYYDGLARYLALGNDHDVEDPGSESWFRNVTLYERPISLNDAVFESYAPDVQDLVGGAKVDGGQVTLTGNTWKALSLPYTVTEHTVLEFDFASLQPGELQGIGVATDTVFRYEHPFFVLTGTQTFFGNRDYYDAQFSSGEVRSVRIDLGQYFVGDIAHLVFGNDHDVSAPDASARFEHIRIYEQLHSTDPSDRGDGWWTARHQQKIDEAKATGDDAKILAIGDSITHYWETTGGESWDEHFAPHHAINLGYSGDRTEEILYRLQSGELDGLKPQLAMVLAGTNNIGHRFDTAAEVAAGVHAIVEELRTRTPGVKILLVGLLPRDNSAGQWTRSQEANVLLRLEADAPDVTYLDLESLFLDANGAVDTTRMPDGLHPNALGYQVWAEAVAAYLS